MTALNHCHNRQPLAKTIKVQDGWKDVTVAPAYGPAKTITVPNIVERPTRWDDVCHYVTSQEGQRDKGCVGCRLFRQVA